MKKGSGGDRRDNVESTGTEARPSRSSQVKVSIPLAAEDESDRMQHVQTDLSATEARVLKRLTRALMSMHAEVGPNIYVSSGAKAIKWLLQEIARQDAA